MPDQDYDTTTGDPTTPYLPTFTTGGFEPLPDRVKPAPASGRYPQLAEPEPAIAPAPVFEPPAEIEEPTSEPILASAQPVTVPGSYQHLKRWVFVLVVAAVWLVAAAIGVGLYQYWYLDADRFKRWSVFAVLVYVVACTVGGLLAAMVQNKPKVSALAIALMSSPLASTAGAAALYGAYVFGWIAR